MLLPCYVFYALAGNILTALARNVKSKRRYAYILSTER